LQQQSEIFSNVILVWFFAMKTLKGAYNLTKDLSCKPLIILSMKPAVLLPQTPSLFFPFQGNPLFIFKSKTGGF
jgi:hypothetical protein